METENKVKYGPYFVYRDSTIIDARNGKKIKKHLRNGKYVVGLRMNTDKKCIYYHLPRLLYQIFVDDSITRYDYIVPLDNDFLNLELSNWKKCSASDFHREKHIAGRKRIVTSDMEKKIFTLHEKGISLRKIGAECGISSCTVHKVVNGQYGKGKESRKSK